MRYEWIDEYLLNKAGSAKDLQKDWNWIRYQIGGKMFAAVCLDENNVPIYITLKRCLEVSARKSSGNFLK